MNKCRFFISLTQIIIETSDYKGFPQQIVTYTVKISMFNVQCEFTCFVFYLFDSNFVDVACVCSVPVPEKHIRYLTN